jgi:transitional endoplasmic reticulum ATPase
MFTKSTKPYDLDQPDALTSLWILRILVPLGGHNVLFSRLGFSNDDVARAAGLGAWGDDEESDFDEKALRKKLRDMHRLAEQSAHLARPSATLERNMTRLAQLVGLSRTDCRILEFAAMLHQDRTLDDCADTLGNLNSLKVIDTLARLLDLPVEEVRVSLSPHGLLARSGLLVVERSGTGYLRGRLDVLSGDFADHILATEADPVSLLRDIISPSQAPRLGLHDYAHLEQVLGMLKPYLETAVAQGRPGVNVFLYGAPGTGKSELARALAAAVGCELFEVASEDTDGDPVNGERRLRAYRAAQSFFCQRQTMLVFDEVEDVFSDGDTMFGKKSTAQRRKAWINRMLEQNQVPTMWLSNSIDHIDPAFMRRFDFVVEMPVPPRMQREHIVRAACDDLLDEGAVKRLAQCDDLAPAVVSRAASVVRAIRSQFDPVGAARAVEFLVDQSLEAQGFPALRHTDASSLPAVYDAALVHTDTDLQQLANGLAATRAGRLCLYGPPGTGKTAYARWLGGYLNMPLVLYSASELISKWVGESEKNIARAFRRAERENALLLIDEVDSFLQDRNGARQSWEVTMVNEMLTRLESFSGIFIASTNLMNDIDSAALRRFDLKVRFDFLAPSQAVTLFERYCHALSLARPGDAECEQMRRLQSATPGDFAAVARRHRFAPLVSPAALVAAVEAECSLKQRKTGTIGFVQ